MALPLRFQMTDDDTRGLGIAYLALAEALADHAPKAFRQVMADVYAALDKEQEERPGADLTLGFEFTELAEAAEPGNGPETAPPVLP